MQSSTGPGRGPCVLLTKQSACFVFVQGPPTMYPVSSQTGPYSGVHICCSIIQLGFGTVYLWHSILGVQHFIRCLLASAIMLLMASVLYNMLAMGSPPQQPEPILESNAWLIMCMVFACFADPISALCSAPWGCQRRDTTTGPTAHPDMTQPLPAN